MCHSPARYLLIALLIVCGLPALAQTSTVSDPLNGRENDPYSKIGIGELLNGNNTVLRGMGNITSAYASATQVNTDNPASYSFLTRTTFEAGATGSMRTVSSSDLSYRTGTATLSYLNIAFPVNKHGGIVLGFRPYSHVYYSLADTTAITGPLAQTIRSYNGDGALNNAFIGASGRIRGLSIGFNLGYLFGTIRNTSAVIPMNLLSTNYGYNAEYTNYTHVGGLQWKGGAMYEAKLDSFYTLHIGGTLTIGQNIRERLSAFQVSSFAFGDTTVRDTINNAGDQLGSLHLPLSYSIGIMLAKNDKWSVGVDYTAANWKDFRSTPNTDLTTDVASDAYRVSLGGELTPDMNNITNYFSRVTYRAGLYYGKDYISPASHDIPYYGFTLGASLPFRRSLSHVHLALDAGTLGTTQNNLIKENYIRFTVGMSFNDLWFVRRRFE